MNVTSITYSNYQNGFIYNPTQKPSIEGSDRSEKKSNSSFHPVVTTSVNTGVHTITKQPVTEATPSDTKNNNERNPQGKSSEAQTQTETVPHADQGLTEGELKLVEDLKQVDSEIRRHEMAHIAAGGQYITSSANFSFKRGPDGKNYAVAGEVGIDTSPIPGDPQGTIRKMRQIKSAALAPGNPSPQDLKVASQATSVSSKALSELTIMQAKDQARSNESKAFGNMKNATDTYERVNLLPEGETSSFQIAV